MLENIFIAEEKSLAQRRRGLSRSIDFANQLEIDRAVTANGLDFIQLRMVEEFKLQHVADGEGRGCLNWQGVHFGTGYHGVVSKAA